MVIDLQKTADELMACKTREQVVGKLYWFIEAVRGSMRDQCATLAGESEPWAVCNDPDCRCGHHTRMAIEGKIRAEA